MIVITPQIDPARDFAIGPTLFMTERNEHEVRCGVCARPMYVDDETYQGGNDPGNYGLANPYRCEICVEEYDELVYNG